MNKGWGAAKPGRSSSKSYHTKPKAPKTINNPEFSDSVMADVNEKVMTTSDHSTQTRTTHFRKENR